MGSSNREGPITDDHSVYNPLCGALRSDMRLGVSVTKDYKASLARSIIFAVTVTYSR